MHVAGPNMTPEGVAKMDYDSWLRATVRGTAMPTDIGVVAGARWMKARLDPIRDSGTTVRMLRVARNPDTEEVEI